MQSSTKNNRPIIIVPASFNQGNICTLNAKAFLQDGQYQVPPPTGQAASPVLVDRKINGETVTFEVHDSVLSFTQSQWNRIVAVFVMGQEWQFKDWLEKLGGARRYVELFLRVRGYYLHFQDAGTVPEVIARWNLKLLPL